MREKKMQRGVVRYNPNNELPYVECRLVVNKAPAAMMIHDVYMIAMMIAI